MNVIDEYSEKATELRKFLDEFTADPGKWEYENIFQVSTPTPSGRLRLKVMLW